MQSLASFRCYGKRLFAQRIGLGTVHDRTPALTPTQAGIAMLAHWARDLPDWPA
jgi:hypothetical protein